MRESLGEKKRHFLCVKKKLFKNYTMDSQTVSLIILWLINTYEKERRWHTAAYVSQLIKIHYRGAVKVLWVYWKGWVSFGINDYFFYRRQRLEQLKKGNDNLVPNKFSSLIDSFSFFFSLDPNRKRLRKSRKSSQLLSSSELTACKAANLSFVMAIPLLS